MPALNSRPLPCTGRDPEATRQRIIDAAFQEIHRSGFQGMRLDHVLAGAGITKGGFYHHFASKLALGYAVIDTVIHAHVSAVWVEPLENSDQPLQTLIDIITKLGLTMDDTVISLGCPLNNLAQEMSPLDEGFRLRINRIYLMWEEALVRALERGQRLQQVRAGIIVRESALFVLAAMEGSIGMAKNAQSVDVLMECGSGLIAYLESLAINSAAKVME